MAARNSALEGRGRRSERLWIGDDFILTLNQAAGVLSGGDVSQADVSGGDPEKWNSRPDEHRNPRHDQALDEARPKESLYRDAAIDIGVADAARGKLSRQGRGLASEVLYNRAGRAGAKWLRTQHVDGLGAVGPLIEAQDGLVGVAANDKRVD